ncbi:CDP-glycerol glycerophosphotransferase family protein [Olivibacter ginsenosidimutans]|uniref:CDP-glycerol glycerophosphotransferase family protein n=1 Tax=Olivibacter ginsenosidimutans TaxID=1176537 RepID=A0ABP9AI97_9SPHI
MLLKRLQRKDKIKVAFFVVHASVWKLDELYRLMEADERFEPIIVIIPYVVFGDEQMRADMDLGYTLFATKGYRVVKTFNEKTNSWLNVKEAIQPDIIFYTNPHELTKPAYYIDHFPDVLSCYVQYSFHITHLHEMQYNQLFHNILWRAFYETDMHLGFAQQYAANRGSNVAVVGYAGTDVFLQSAEHKTDPWKIKNPAVKRIIWAPHHTIDDDKSFLSYSSFLVYADFFLQLADQYADKLQLAFKPHPILRPKLSDPHVWGKKKTDAYYAQWEQGTNTHLFEADYVDLFKTSDALIHDSASFLVEYLYLHKPTLYTLRDERVTDRFNGFGKLAFHVHEHANSEQDIIYFIQHTVLQGNDVKEEERKQFFNRYLIPPYGKSASAHIIDEIKRFVY